MAWQEDEFEERRIHRGGGSGFGYIRAPEDLLAPRYGASRYEFEDGTPSPPPPRRRKTLPARFAPNLNPAPPPADIADINQFPPTPIIIRERLQVRNASELTQNRARLNV